MRAAVVGVIVSLLGACSSNGKPAAGGGSTGGGGAGGRAGASGQSSEGGAGGLGGGSGLAGTGGALGNDAGADVPASEGGAPVDAEQACRAAVRARCLRLGACAGDFSNRSTCPTVAATCPEYFFNQASTRTVAGIAACLDELAQQSCTEVQLGLFPPCWSRGVRPGGAPCAYPSNCAGGGCSSSGARCGVCAADPAATGESCATVGCRAGDFCHAGTLRCTSATTLVLAAQGEACDLTAEPAVGCRGDLHCITPAGMSAATTPGTCQPLASLDIGQPCYQTAGVCGASLICFTDFGTSPPASRCVAEPLEPLCGTAQCDDTTYCVSGDGGQHCAPRAAVGEHCLGDGGVVSPPCVGEAICLGATGVCTRYGGRGDACTDGTQPCESYLVCTNGHCASLDTDTCPIGPVDGSAG